MQTSAITVLASFEIEGMRQAGKAAAMLLRFLETLIKPGINTQSLDEAAATWAQERGYKHAPLNYQGFPKHICTSPNEVVCHGIPSPECILQDGDIINLDVTLNVNGWHGDTSKTFIVGQTTEELNKLVKITNECLFKGIEIVRPNLLLSEIGKVIHQYAQANQLYVIKEFCGHGIGRAMHMEPSVPHIYVPNPIRLRPGMCFTIEPILSIKPDEVQLLKDNWTVITKNRSCTAQFEHTVLVTEEGCDILTL